MSDSEIDIVSQYLATQCKLCFFTACQDCPTGNSCNDVIGCDACARGKQQPDCVKGRLYICEISWPVMYYYGSTSWKGLSEERVL